MKIGKPINENSSKDLERIKILLQNLFKLLMEYGGRTLTPGIKNMLITLADEGCSLDIRMDKSGTIFKDMLGGMGTLGDFGIFHSDEETEEILNKQLKDIKDELWDLFGINLSHLPDVDEGYPPGHPYWNIKNPKGRDEEDKV